MNRFIILGFLVVLIFNCTQSNNKSTSIIPSTTMPKLDNHLSAIDNVVFYVTRDNTYLRKEPSEDAKVILTLNNGNAVLALGKTKTVEEIAPFGRHPWYYVSYNLPENDASKAFGYIFGGLVIEYAPD